MDIDNLDDIVSLACTIPDSLRTRLLDSTASVRELLQLEKLPSLDCTNSSPLSGFSFSTAAPECDIQELCARTIPPLQHLYMLKSQLTTAVLASKCSFSDWRYKNRPTPLFMIPFWLQQGRAVVAQWKWSQSEEWLVSLCKGQCRATAVAAEEALTMLEDLEWDTRLSGSRETPGVSVEELQPLLEHSRLKSNVIDAMLTIIRRRHANRGQDVPSVEIRDLTAFEALRSASEFDWASYETNRVFCALRDLGTRVAKGFVDVIYLPLNIRDNHWTLFALDVKEECLRYGDSTGLPADPKDVNLIARWLSQHGLRVTGKGSIPIAAQPGSDQVSCGMLVINAIAHEVLGDVLWTEQARDLLRLKAFISLVEDHWGSEEWGLDIPEPTSYDQPASTASSAGPSSSVPIDPALLTPPPTLSPAGAQSLSFQEDPFLAAIADKVVQATASGHRTKAETKKKKTEKANTGVKDLSKELEKPGGLLRFFPVNGPGDRERQLAETADKDRERAEELQQLSERLGEVQREKEKDQARQRQQKRRDRIREDQIADGTRDPVTGKKRKAVVLVADRQKPNLLPSGQTVAEASRPHRALKDQAKARAHQDETNGTKASASHDHKKAPKMAKSTHWHAPLLWVHIDAAAKACMPKMRQRDIVKYLKHHHNATGVFNGLTEQVVGRMIEREERKPPRWSDATMDAVRNARGPRGNVTRAGILTTYPDAYNAIVQQLKQLRAAKIRISAGMAQAIMIAVLRERAPEVFNTSTKHGKFKCSISFVRRFLQVHLQWSIRKATRAAQKIPKDAPDLCRASFCRQALSIRDFRIPDALRVNIDQAQCVLMDTCGRTYEVTNSKQVTCIGKEEKRAFTILVGVSASGAALPFQAIWKGKSAGSLPSRSARGYAEAQKLGFRFESSMTDNYWSTFATMCSYVTHILVPYLNSIKEQLGLSPDQECILQLDVWSVHRSEQFRTWMKTTYPWIILDFVPGGCTGIWQPCDVGIQRLMKLAIRRAQHDDLVTEVQSKLHAGVSPADLRIDDSLGTLRNRSVQWLVTAYNEINDKIIVEKAFSGCRLADKDLNLSQASLTSRKALQLLQHIEKNEPGFWAELKKGSRTPRVREEEAAYPDDRECPDYPDASIPLHVAKAHISNEGYILPSGYACAADGTLVALEDEAVLDADWPDHVDVEYTDRADEPDEVDEASSSL